MTIYHVLGFDPLSPRVAFEAFSFLLREAAGCDDRVCLTVHTDDIEVIHDVAATDISEVSLFGWKELPLQEFWRLNIRSSPRSVIVFCGDYRVIAREYWELPFYDWPEAWTTQGMVTLQHSVPKENRPLSNQMEPEPPIAEKLAGAMANESGRSDLKVLHSSTVLNDQVVHIYNVRVPLDYLTLGFRAALSLLPPALVSAGFELTVAPHRLKQLQSNRSLAGLPFPDKQLCLSPFSTIMAIASQGISYPVPNLELVRAGQAFERGWTHRDTVRFQGLKRGFLSWRSRDGLRSSRTMGNYAILIIEKALCVIEVGIEQFDDKDVPVRSVKKELEHILKPNRLRLERI